MDRPLEDTVERPGGREDRQLPVGVREIAFEPNERAEVPHPAGELGAVQKDREGSPHAAATLRDGVVVVAMLLRNRLP
nr:hypothetical protein [Halopenitus malekzadehii]